MTNKEKKIWLKRYRNIQIDIDCWQSEIEIWRSRAEKMTSTISGMPRGGKILNIDDIIVEMDEIIRKIKIKIKEAEIIKLEIEIAIGKLEERLERVLRYRYINCLSWGQIAILMGYEARQIYRLHGQALKKLEIK